MKQLEGKVGSLQEGLGKPGEGENLLMEVVGTKLEGVLSSQLEEGQTLEVMVVVMLEEIVVVMLEAMVVVKLVVVLMQAAVVVILEERQ